MICPVCKSEIRDNAIFCTNCGVKLDRKCPQCNALLEPSAVFCTNCGTKIKYAVVSSVDNSNKSILPTNKEKFTKNLAEKKEADLKAKAERIQRENKKNEKLAKKQAKREERAKAAREKAETKIKKIESKFGVSLKGKSWFQCQVEEVKASTFTNEPRRNVDTAYVILEDNYIHVLKESVFIKTNMGSRKLYYENIASIDYDARGLFHASSSLFINLKSAEAVQLKFVSSNDAARTTKKFEDYLANKDQPVQQPFEINRETYETTSKPSESTPKIEFSVADEIEKFGKLYKEGLLTEEEFNAKKKQLLDL